MDFADKSSAATASIVINKDAVKPTTFDRLNQEDKADLLLKSTKPSNGGKKDHSKLVFPNIEAQNMNEVNFSDLLNIGEDGIEQSEFKALAASSEPQFIKDTSQGIQDIMEFISASKENAADAFGRADICRREGRARLIINKGKIQEIYGYEIGNDTYLYAEEALYLLERGKLEIYCDHIRLSVERARAILLHSKSTSELSSCSVVTCDIDEYSVYKYLARLGMRIRRRREESSNIQHLRGNNGDINESLSIGKSAGSNMFMETGCDNASLSFQCAGAAEINYDDDINRGVKRKLEDDSDAFNAPLPLSEKQSLESMNVPCDVEDMETKCELSGNTEDNSYTVVEADSDIEFDCDDSFTFNDLVYIEEVPEGFAAASEPKEEMPCSSRSIRPNYEPQMVVDLPSSDSEAEDDNKYINKIWSQFVPGLNIKIEFPPSHLLPSSIGTRKEEYQFDFKRKLNPCADLEYFVDELDLNESPLEQDQKVYCKSWTEWRQIMVEEAKEIRNTSLLANSDFKSDNVINKLNLWDNNTTDTDNSQPADGQTFHKFSSTYDIYPQSCCRVHKRRLLTHHKPSFRLAIVRSDEPIPELHPTTNDIPIVIAIVNDENEILFLSPESVPLTSLF